MAAPPTLRGPRVLLRPLVESDADSLLRGTQDPELRRLTGTRRRFTLADAVSWCVSRDEAEGRYDRAVVDATAGDWLDDAALSSGGAVARAAAAECARRGRRSVGVCRSGTLDDLGSGSRPR